MNVKLQARLGMIARQIHFAGGHQEVTVNEMHQPVRQISREIRPVIRRAIFAQTPCNIHARVFFAGELDVWIGLVVSQQDVEARLPLLDEIILQRERLFLVVDQDVVDVASFGEERICLRIR